MSHRVLNTIRAPDRGREEHEMVLATPSKAVFQRFRYNGASRKRYSNGDILNLDNFNAAPLAGRE